MADETKTPPAADAAGPDDTSSMPVIAGDEPEKYRATMRCFMGMPGREHLLTEGEEIILPPSIGDQYPECLEPLTPRKKGKKAKSGDG